MVTNSKSKTFTPPTVQPGADGYFFTCLGFFCLLEDVLLRRTWHFPPGLILEWPREIFVHLKVIRVYWGCQSNLVLSQIFCGDIQLGNFYFFYKNILL